MVLANPKHEAFAHYLAKGKSATDAYVCAGYSDKGAHASANRLLQNATICSRVKELQRAVAEIAITSTGITVARVLEEYAKLAFLDIRKAFDEDGNLKPIHELDDATAGAIAGLEAEELHVGRGESRKLIGRLQKIKLSDKRAALDSIAKHLGMFVDRQELTGPNGGPIEQIQRIERVIVSPQDTDT